MLEVVSNYKLINLDVDGKEKTVQINPSDAWSVMEVVVNGNTLTVNEGDEISFSTENGELKKGTITKIQSSGEKTKFVMTPFGEEHDEVWMVRSIKSDSLKVLKSDEIEEDDE